MAHPNPGTSEDPCQQLPSVAAISPEGVGKMKQAGLPNAAVAGNATLGGFPSGLMPNLGKIHHTAATPRPDKAWVLQAAQPVNGFLPHFNSLTPHVKLEGAPPMKMDGMPHIKMDGSAHMKMDRLPHIKMDSPAHIRTDSRSHIKLDGTPHIKMEPSPHPQTEVKHPERVYPEMDRSLDSRTVMDGRSSADGRRSNEGRGLERGPSMEDRALLERGFRDLNQLHQYWSHAAQRVPSPHSEKQIMLHQRMNSGNGASVTHNQLSNPPRQYSPHPKVPINSAATTPPEARNSPSSHIHNLHNSSSPHPPQAPRESYPSPHLSPNHSPHLSPQPQTISQEVYQPLHLQRTDQETYSPVDLAAESLLSLSGSAPKKGFSFPTQDKDLPSQLQWDSQHKLKHDSPVCQKLVQNNTRQLKQLSKDPPKDPSIDHKNSRLPSSSLSSSSSSSSPFTKVSQINKLATPEGYALLANMAPRGPSTLASRPPVTKGLQPGEQITTPSPKVHILPTYASIGGSGGHHNSGPTFSPSHSLGQRHLLDADGPFVGDSTLPGCKTPERGAGSPPSKVTPMTPEEVQERRLQMLSKNEKLEAPKCNCLGHDDMDEAPYYTHLGAGPSIPAIRKLMEERFGQSGECIRIEKVVYSGKEGKSSQGCPIAKWIIRRSSDEEKVLALIRNRPGHHCETANIIIGIVAWEGVEANAADYFYELLRTTLPLRAIPTIRKCATNEEKTCACQGFDPDTCGASFSFGCSWSMYYNACKFARSKTPRKFKLMDSDPIGEETLEAHFQHLAGEIGPLYKKLAPDSYLNQVAFEDHAKDCRLGHAEGRPFSGVTACMDFCAHAHRDNQNMNNGSTVVVTLTKESIRNLRPTPGDEQLHILPLYYLDSTDEFGSSEGQQEKVRNGSLEVLTAYRHKTRRREKPVIPKGAVRPRNSTSHDKSSPAKSSKTVANLLASKSSNSEEKKRAPPAASTPPASCPSEPKKEFKNSSRSAFASVKESNSQWGAPHIKQEFPPSNMDPRWSNEMMNGATGLHGGHRSNYPLHLEAMNGLRPEIMHEYMAPLYPGLSPYLPHGYPPIGMVTPEQLQANPQLAQLLPQYAAAAAMDPYLSSYMRLPHHYPGSPLPHHLEHDIKPDPQQLNEMILQGFGKTFGMQRGEPELKYARTMEHRQTSLNGTYPRTSSATGYPHSNTPQDAIWRPPIFQSSHPAGTGEPRPASTPINAMEQSVSALPANCRVKQEDPSSKHIPCPQSGPKFIATTPLRDEHQQPEPCGSPDPREEEYDSDSERSFEDPTIGGVAVALSHGAVLFEVAKRELHATSSLQTPCRQNPTRISLVFYQHKQLNYKHHGIEFYEKKVEAKRQLQMEEGKLPLPKKGQKRSAAASALDDAKSAKVPKESGTPTRQAVTPHTHTVVTVASYAPTKVTGPYQSPQGKITPQSKESQKQTKESEKKTKNSQQTKTSQQSKTSQPPKTSQRPKTPTGPAKKVPKESVPSSER